MLPSLLYCPQCSEDRLDYGTDFRTYHCRNCGTTSTITFPSALLTEIQRVQWECLDGKRPHPADQAEALGTAKGGVS